MDKSDISALSRDGFVPIFILERFADYCFASGLREEALFV
jgi:hypothetical protein